MTHYDSSRRDFLQQSMTVAGASWAKVILPGLAAISQAACTAKENQAPFTNLGDAEAVEFEAIVARILPTTDTPGAREAGVIYFFDQTFGSFNAPMLDVARGGLAKLQSGIDGDIKFSILTDEQVDAHLGAIEQTPFFGLMRFMTLCGFFGMSKYGGNRDGIGWKLVGMEPGMRAYQSPFGYYDAEYLEEHPDG